MDYAHAAIAGSVAVNSRDGKSFSPFYMVPNRSTVALTVFNAEGRVG